MPDKLPAAKHVSLIGVGPLYDDMESAMSHVAKKPDGRLYPHALYCEGRPKPLFRGRLHAFCAALLPIGAWHLLNEAGDSGYGQIAALVYVGTNIFCYGVSGLYHTLVWSPKVEILLQKLDHVGIALLTCGTFLPMQLLLLAPYAPSMAGLFVALELLALLVVVHHIFVKVRNAHGDLDATVQLPFQSSNLFSSLPIPPQSTPSITQLVLVVATFVPFVPLLLAVMTPLELMATLLTVLFKGAATLVFHYERPNGPYPRLCNYHEVFHLLVVIAGACIYVANWSIIRRTCNPYARHPDIWEMFKEYMNWSQAGGVDGGIESFVGAVESSADLVAAQFQTSYRR
jgi:hemolysin III